MADWDGPLLKSLRVLLLRPGQLTREYRNGRFKSQVSPVRLYLATAGAYFLLLPIWGEWTVQTDDFGSYESFAVNFPSASALALVVPIWAGIVWVAVMDRRLFFEEAFAFSVHFHVVWLVLFTAIGLLASVGSRVGAAPYLTTLPYTLLLVVPPGYIYSALRVAFGIGRGRSAATAGVLMALQLAAVGLAAELL